MKIGKYLRIAFGILMGSVLVVIGVSVARHPGNETDGFMMMLLAIAIVHTICAKPRSPNERPGG